MSWWQRQPGSVGRVNPRRIGISPNLTNQNLLLNGGFRQAQRGTSFVAGDNDDDVYTLDRWILLSDGDDIVDLSQITGADAPTGSYSALKFDIETINKKCGILQILEARDAATIIGGRASLSFKAKTESGPEVANLRAAIISWDGTADTVTSDVVGTWEAAGTDPTLITSPSNWVYENTPLDLALTTSYQTFKIDNVSIDTSGAANVGVFIWADDDDMALDDVFWIADVKLERDSVATAFQNPPIGSEQAECKRFFEHFSYDSATSEAIANLPRRDIDGDDWWGVFRYVEKRIAPAITFTARTTFDADFDATENANLATSIAADRIGRYSCRIVALSSGQPSLTADTATLHRDGTDICSITVDAEL